MTPERWQRIKRLFDEALPLDESGRVALLENSVDLDRETVQDVLRLLARSESAEGFLERPVGDARRILSDAAQEAQPTLSTGQRLGKRFVIERFIAHGGMGEVYRAFDSELAVPVAIKTLRREYARDTAFVDRFRREVQLAHDVYGEHLCRIFDIGRDGEGEDSIVYLSMEFLDGPTLRDVIRQEAPLSTDRALPVLRQIADGLESLSHCGMVHRDLKPGNIVLEGWNTPNVRAVITDFGLAKPSLASHNGEYGDSQDLQSTHSGRLAGTPDYMAPEQLNGKPVGPATDIYAFGIVAYEMITGKRPFPSNGWESAFLRLNEDPKPPRSHTPMLPALWDRAILQCLSVNAENRPRSAKLVTDVLAGEVPATALKRGTLGRRRTGHPILKHIALVAAMILVGIAGWFAASSRWLRGPMVDPPIAGKHIAVLPFSHSELDPQLSPYADGLMDTITRRLSQFEQANNQLLVVPSSEVRGQNVASTADALKRFKIDYAVEGRVDSQDDRVRLTLTVVDAATMRQLETSVIEEPRSRLLNLQDGAIAKLSNALKLQVTQTRNTEAASTLRISPAAYDFYLQGRGYLQRNDREEDVRNAVKLFEHALQIDQKYPLALAGLADAQWFLYERTRNSDWVELARKSAAAALRSNRQIPDVHITMGRIQNGTGDHEGAVASYQEALKLDSRNPDALYGLGSAYARLNHSDLAESTYLRAVSYRPSDWRAHKQLGIYYLGNGEYRKALKPLQYVVDLTPDNAQGYNNLGVAHYRLGEYDEARNNFEKTMQLDPRVSALTNIASVEFNAGNFQKSIEWSRRALAMNENSYRVWGNVGSAYLKLGNRMEAEAAYQRAIDLVKGELQVNPKSGALFSHLAHYQAGLQLRNDAVTNIHKSELYEPKDPDVYLRNAETWMDLGNEKNAGAALRKAIQNGFKVSALSKTSGLVPIAHQLLSESSSSPK